MTKSLFAILMATVILGPINCSRNPTVPIPVLNLTSNASGNSIRIVEFELATFSITVQNGSGQNVTVSGLPSGATFDYIQSSDSGYFSWQTTHTSAGTYQIAFKFDLTYESMSLVVELVVLDLDVVYLSQLEPVDTANIPLQIGLDECFWCAFGGSINIDSTVYDHGIAMYPPFGWDPPVASASFIIGGEYATFSSLVGWAAGDSSWTSHANCTNTEFAFRVYCDGVLVHSGNPNIGSPVQISLNVVGTNKITLEIDNADNNNSCDNSVWADAKVTK